MVDRAHPLYCIVPPYLLREIVERGTAAQREWAIKTLRVTNQLTEKRAEVASGSQPLMHGTGTPVAPSAAVAAVPNRIVYDAQNSSALPGTIARSEGAPPSTDPAINEAYDGAGDTFDLFLQVYERNSIDNAGMRIDSSVHYMRSYDNAFWNGEQMVYGDGDEDLPIDQRIFNRFTISLDVIAHELTHGVTQYESNLTYSGQSGALNESFSDVFGILVKQRRLGQTAAQSDWLIGQGLFTSNINAQGVRSMKAPGTAYDDPLLGVDPQPDHMSKYVNTLDDNGGVHINSGIPNRAFYETSLLLGGYAWEKAGRIWYAALNKRLPANASFQVCANTLHTIAGEMFGPGSTEQQSVAQGWAMVGITVSGGTQPPPPDNTNPGCFSSLLGFLRPRSGG